MQLSHYATAENSIFPFHPMMLMPETERLIRTLGARPCALMTHCTLCWRRNRSAETAQSRGGANVSTFWPSSTVQKGLSYATRTGTLFCPNRSEEHTSELQSLMRISYPVVCLKDKNTKQQHRAAATSPQD